MPGVSALTKMYPVPAERREDSLNLGGNTDDRFALSILHRCLGLFFLKKEVVK